MDNVTNKNNKMEAIRGLMKYIKMDSGDFKIDEK